MDRLAGQLTLAPQPHLRLNKRDLTEQEKLDIAKGYVRPTLAKGLRMQSDIGINPFKYGFVGATDSHSSQPGSAEEDNWRGALGQWDMDLKDQQIYAAYNPGGITAIWAEENSRQALFAALQRREVYATSGTRIKLRVHQTFAEPSAINCATVPRHSIPMGGTFASTKESANPLLLSRPQDRTPLAQ